MFYLHLNLHLLSFHSCCQVAPAHGLRGLSRKWPLAVASISRHTSIQHGLQATPLLFRMVEFEAQLYFIQTNNQISKLLCFSGFWFCLTLTADSNSFARFCRNTISICCIAQNLLHVLGNVLYGHNHTSPNSLTNQMSADIQWNGWDWITQGQTKDRHWTAFRNDFWLNGRRLIIK